MSIKKLDSPGAISEEPTHYIYSMFAFGSISSIISASTLEGNAFAAAITIIGLICTSMTLHPQYKKFDNMVHKTVVFTSIGILVSFILYTFAIGKDKK